MKRVSLLIIGFIFFSLMSCLKKFEDDNFTLNRLDYYGNQLRVDGYYYSNPPGDEYSCLYVFYHNGIALIPGYTDDPDTYIQEFVNGFNKKIKTFWGVYSIENNIIRIEYYMPKMIEGLPAYIRSGVILNDTTFVLEEEKRSRDGSELKVINEIYNFKKINPKPDSLNRFIK